MFFDGERGESEVSQEATRKPLRELQLRRVHTAKAQSNCGRYYCLITSDITEAG